MRPVRTIYLVIAVLVLGLVGIVASDLQLFDGLSFDVRRILGWNAFGANLIVGIYGAIVSNRIAWIGYLVLSVAGLLLMGATTPIVALWLALKLL